MTAPAEEEWADVQHSYRKALVVELSQSGSDDLEALVQMASDKLA